ncbi:MAG: hypothetical protein GX557_01495, partial [Chloroflexi bacterium]|nr:hypothetical protein [Chloroflexota bacterium]
ERRVPNLLVLPAVLVVLVWRVREVWVGASACKLAGMLLGWAAAFALWSLHLWGAGDAKLVMVLAGLFPTAEFALLLAAVIVLCGVPRIIVDRRRGERVAASAGAQIAWLPSPGTLRARGQPDAWVLALAGILYAWLRL